MSARDAIKRVAGDSELAKLLRDADEHGEKWLGALQSMDERLSLILSRESGQ